MDDIFLTVDWDRDPPNVLALVRENHDPNGPARICEVGSRMVREHFETLPYIGADVDAFRQRRHQDFARRAKSLAAVLAANAAQLLAPSEREAIADTVGDRAMADAIARGAKMGPDGRIPGVDY